MSNWFSEYPICHILGPTPLPMWQQQNTTSTYKCPCVAGGGMTVTDRPPSSLVLFRIHTLPAWLSIYLRNISVKILPLTKTGRWGQSAGSNRFLSVCLIVSVTVFRTPGTTWQSPWGQALLSWTPGQMIHPSTEHSNDTLTGPRFQWVIRFL